MPLNFRDRFNVPVLKNGEEVAYLVGNSLGLMPHKTRDYVNQEMDAWSQLGVKGHFVSGQEDLGQDVHQGPWYSCDEPLHGLVGPILGASEDEVAIMNTLTSNIHSLFSAFYKPTAQRNKILFEAKAFPSDTYAMEAQARLHNLDPNEALIKLAPKDGLHTLSDDDIIKVIEEQGDEIAVVFFSGIQFYTGQLFDIPRITAAAKAKGCVVGWDLAHAAGNVPLQLHNWNVDFAVFCTYKYMNSGPGGIGGLFVHDKYADDQRPRLAGWWGNNAETRFKMLDEFDPIRGARGYKQSNPSVLCVLALRASLELFKEAGGIQKLRERSIELTNRLLKGLLASPHYIAPENVEIFGNSGKAWFTIITPQAEHQRGAQLSLLFGPDGTMKKVFDYLDDNGVLGDERNPDVIRLAPAPLYNNERDVDLAIKLINDSINLINGSA